MYVLNCTAHLFQGHIEASQTMLRQFLEEQRLRGEHLEEQLNDMEGGGDPRSYVATNAWF